MTQRTPKTGMSSLYFSQPDLSSQSSQMEEPEFIKKMNLKKRKNDYDLAEDLKESLTKSFKDMLNNEVTEMKQQNLQILKSNTEIIQLLQKNAASYKDISDRMNTLELNHAIALDRINDLEMQLNIYQKQQKRNMIEMRNVPRQDNEDLQNVIFNLHKTLDIQPMSEIKQVFRKGKGDSPITIEFSNINQKELILRAVKKFNKTNCDSQLNSGHLGIKEKNTKIYVSESLTTITKKILTAARDLVKNGHFKYCWTSRGNVLVRKDDGEPAIQITTLSQINSLVST